MAGGRLAWVEGFAQQWHAGQWRLSGLPAAIGVDLLFRRESALVLGAAIALDECCRAIFVNDLIASTPLFWPIVAHETAHLLAGDAPVQLCHAQLTCPTGETVAWLGAARLCISTEQLNAILDHRADPEDIAESNSIPLEMVNLRLASDGQDSLVTVGDALLAWVGYVNRITTAL